MRSTALALATVLVGCSAAPPRQAAPPVVEPWDIVLACEQPDTTERMECMLEDRPGMTRDAYWWRERIRRIYIRAQHGAHPDDVAHDLASLEVRLMDLAQVALDARYAHRTPVAAAPIAPLHPNWLGTGVGTPRFTCIPGAGSVSCY